MQTIYMMVYSYIENDARVQRAANALSVDYEVIVFAVGNLPNASNTFKYIPSKRCKKLGGYKAYINFIIEAERLAIKLKPDIIYAHDIFTAWPLLRIKKHRFAEKYIYDAHELFMKVPEEKLSFSNQILYAIESKAIKNSDLVICANEQRAEIMQKYHGLIEKPLVIRNISYLPDVEKGINKDVLDKCFDFFEINAFSVVYAGGILAGRKLDMLVDAVNDLGVGYKLLLIGDGPFYSDIKNKIDLLCNDNIRIIKTVPYNELASIIKHFDAGYLYYPVDNLNNLYCAPNKIFEYASVGLPIISNSNPTILSNIEKYGIGCCNNDLKEAIKYVKVNCSLLKKNIATFIESNNVIEEMNKLIKTLK